MGYASGRRYEWPRWEVLGGCPVVAVVITGGKESQASPGHELAGYLGPVWVGALAGWCLGNWAGLMPDREQGW